MGSAQLGDALSMLEAAQEFKGASRRSLERLAEAMERIELPPRASVFEPGSPSDDIYLIAEGHVRLTYRLGSGREGMIAEMGPGELLGEMTALTGRRRTGAARATSETILWSMPADLLREVVRSDAQLATDLMRATMDLVLDKDISVVLTAEERAQLQRAVDVERKAAQELREHGALKDEQVAIMAHDIRAPLTVILGCSEVLADRWGDLEEERRVEFLRTISRSAKALAELVEDALQVSALESGEMAYDTEALDLVALVGRVVDEFKYGLPGRQIEIEAAAPELKVRCDDRRQWQILTNLLSNAVKFSPDDAPVTIRIAADSAFGHVSVIDRGRGIEPGSLRSLFKKFSRLPDPDGHRTRGTGLGLYICDLLVRAQGGEIWAVSTPGEGSTFTYTVPLA